jgi:hypothetical protein
MRSIELKLDPSDTQDEGLSSSGQSMALHREKAAEKRSITAQREAEILG